MSSESSKFKPGDIVRVVRGTSKEWTFGSPLMVMHQDRWRTYIKSLDNKPPVAEGCHPWVHEEDCELDVFLDAAHKAVKDA